MIYTRNFYPNILIHPGMSLKDILESEEMTQKDLCLRTEISEKHISNIIKGKASITPETALKFEKVFGISSDYWNNLQKAYDEDLARLEEQKLMAIKLEDEKEILSKIKDGYKDLAELGYVEKINFLGNENKENILYNLYNFFKVSTLKNIFKLDVFNTDKFGLSYKKSNSLKLNKYNLACWLRAGEIDVEKLDIGEYSKVRLKNNLSQIKDMTMEDKVDIEKIKSLLAEAGVYFSFIPSFVKVPVFGITRRYKGKPFIQVSSYQKKEDSFWFALFHEIAHVRLHLSKKNDILINIDDKEEIKEKEANDWAGNYLINQEDFIDFSRNIPISNSKLLDFAKNQGVGTSIVAGKLAHHFKNLGYEDAYRDVSSYRKPLEIINN